MVMIILNDMMIQKPIQKLDKTMNQKIKNNNSRVLI